MKNGAPRDPAYWRGPSYRPVRFKRIKPRPYPHVINGHNKGK